MPLGAVRLTERFGLDGPVDAATIAAAREAIAAEFGLLRDRPRPSGLVGMGGAMTNLAAVHHGLAVYDPVIVHGTVLDVAAIDRQIETYRTSDAATRRSIVGLQPARAEVILAGACVVRTILDLLDQPSVTVSDRGLRHGVLSERFRNTIRRGADGQWRNDMTARPAGAPPRLSDDDLVRMMGLMKGSDSVELKLTVPVASPSRDDRQPAARPGRGPAAADLLLRHARSRAGQGGRRGARTADSPVAGVTPSSSFDRSSRTSCRATPAARRRSTSSSMRCPAGSCVRAR